MVGQKINKLTNLQNYMRLIKLTDKNAIEVLNKNTAINVEQEKVIKELRKVEVRGKELEAAFNKNMTASERIMERARPLVKKIIDKEKLEEYEYINKVTQDKKTLEWNIEIGNSLEEFKHTWKHRNDKKEEKKEEVKK